MQQQSKVTPKRRWRSAIVAALALVVAPLTVMVGGVLSAQAADGNILPPFTVGETWKIYQGYGPNAFSHHNNGVYPSLYGLDLTTGGSDTSSGGKTVRSPVGGTIQGNPSTSGAGSMCINMPDGRSLTLTHINTSITGGTVSAGQAVGTVAVAGDKSNNGVAHIHLQMWSSHGCWGTGNGGIPFDSAHGARICGALDLTATGGPINNGVWGGKNIVGAECGGTTVQPTNTSNLIQNGGFNTDTSHWSVSGSANMAVYTSNGGTTPYEGSRFLAANGSQSGDSVWQARSFATGPGDTICASAQIGTVGSSSGASGTFAVWLLDTTTAESSTFSYANVPGNNTWTPVKACVRATSAHATIKVQFYPMPGAPTVAVDAVDMHRSTILNSGFNLDTAHWSAHGSANMTTYAASGSTLPYEGARFGATNGSQSGDSISEEIAAPTGAGDTFCAEAQVVTAGGATGASGTFAIWLTGTTTAEVSTFEYSNLPGGSAWMPIKTCVRASSAHANVKVQFYPTPGAPTVAVDAVDVHKSVIQNGGFNTDTSHWSVSGSANMAVYTSLSGTSPYEGSRFLATNAAQNGDSISEEIAAPTGPGDTFCAEAQVSTIGSGGAGTLAVWLTGSTAAEVSTYVFSGLPGGNTWTPIKTCVTATSAHDNVKVQFYPAVNGPTIAVDVVDVH